MKSGGSLRVVAVVVTYGDRWHLLREVLQELTRHDSALTAIVVVDNCSMYDLPAKLREAEFQDVSLVSLQDNTGSAGGYAAGITHARRRAGFDLIWLLDDDNKPSEGCLRRLLTTYLVLGEDSSIALVGLRKSRTEQLAAIRGEGQMRVRPNSFLGFHLLELPRKISKSFRRSASITASNGWEYPLVSVCYAPYGGLLFHASWVEKIGIPDGRFYVYGDDHEFTGRMIEAGGRIYLAAYCEVSDLELSWSVKPMRAPPLVSALSASGKVFYVVRNRVYWEWSRHVTRPASYFVNIVSYLVLLSLRGLLAERSPLQLLRRVRLIARAIRCGLAGELGKVQLD